jgi:iron(III) transport system substrate-binding protein
MLARVLIALFFSLPAWAQEKGWEKRWDEMVAAAKREGRVIVEGPADPLVRKELPGKFTARFGIPVEYIGGRGSEAVAKIRVERRAGQYTRDVWLSGVNTFANALAPEKMLDPLRPELLLPEVVDGSKWKPGKLWFADPEEKYVLRLLSYLPPIFNLNTQLAHPKEFKSIMDVLHPKWQGKISIVDPTVGGSGPYYAAVLYHQFGEEFTKRLYVDQKPTLSRDTRQLAEWLARGTHAISFGAGSEDMKRLQQEGLPVMRVYSLPDTPGAITAGNGAVGLINRAPHPNAARVFVNWMASKEGLELYSRTRQLATTRNDLDASFVPPEEIPRPGVKYFDAASWEFSIAGEEKTRLRMREILKK